jgi:hypothetical protein
MAAPWTHGSASEVVSLVSCKSHSPLIGSKYARSKGSEMTDNQEAFQAQSGSKGGGRRGWS